MFKISLMVAMPEKKPAKPCITLEERAEQAMDLLSSNQLHTGDGDSEWSFLCKLYKCMQRRPDRHPQLRRKVEDFLVKQGINESKWAPYFDTENIYKRVEDETCG